MEMSRHFEHHQCQLMPYADLEGLFHFMGGDSNHQPLVILFWSARGHLKMRDRSKTLKLDWALVSAMPQVLVCLLNSPPLWSTLKYLNNYWTDLHERYSGSTQDANVFTHPVKKKLNKSFKKQIRHLLCPGCWGRHMILPGKYVSKQ